MEIGNHDLTATTMNGFKVVVPAHPLINHWVSVLRDQATPTHTFRNAMGELGRLLAYDASRDWLPIVQREVESPMGTAIVESVDPMEPVMIVPILRAGLVLAEFMTTIFPSTRTFHLDYLLVDPMLATGGTVAAAVDLLKERGAEISQIRIISAVAAPPAIKKLNERFPGICVYTGAMDQIVNEKGFIVPGLGDAGDRSYGTSECSLLGSLETSMI